MKFLGRTGEELAFALSQREGLALRFVLGRYPSLDPSYHQVTRPGAVAELAEEQQLLVEAMSELQRGNRRQVDEFLERRLRHEGSPAGPVNGQLTLTTTEADWLLEVLNDVRVGAWVRLGRPVPGRTPLPKSSATALADFSALEVAGLFQSVLLSALEA